MLQLLIPVIALLTIFWFFGAYRRGNPKQRRRLVFGFFFLLIFGFVLYLTISGRLHFIAAVVTGLLPFAKQIVPLLRYVPVLRRFVGKVQAETTEVSNEGQMTRSQALEVLGLKEGATKEEIIEAHRKLMQKCHPDRGGNDYLASQLNQAKDLLLS